MAAWKPLRARGKVLYDFQAQGEYQIPLKAGDLVDIAEESQGWLKGALASNPTVRGIFPTNYVQIIDAAAEVAASPAATAAAAGAPAAAAPGTPTGAAAAAGAGAGAAAAAAAARFAKPLPPAERKPLPPAMKPFSAGPTTSSLASASGASAAPAATAAAPAPASASASASTSVGEPAGKPVMGRMPSVADEALNSDILSTLNEWSTTMDTNLQDGNGEEYHRFKERTSALLELRGKFYREADDRKRDLIRDEIIKLIESSRKLREGFMVPRNKDGDMADTKNTGIMELLDNHRVMYGNLREESTRVFAQKAQQRRRSSVLNQRLADTAEDSRDFPQGSVHLFLNVKMCIFAVGEPTELYFSLYNDRQRRFLTEDFIVMQTATGMPENQELIGKLTTLFSDLSAADFAGNLWLVCFIYRRGRLVMEPDKMGKPPEVSYRRPFGCAALNLTEVGAETLLAPKEFEPPPVNIWTLPEATANSFPRIHEMIIRGDKTLELAPKAKGIALSLRLFKGAEDDVRREEKTVSNRTDVPSTRLLDFPPMMQANDPRNDLYIFLLHGNFLQDGKTAAKNIQVTLRVVDALGNTVPNVIFRGSGGAALPLSEYLSTVYYHSNNPTFNEVLRLSIEPGILEHCHLLMTFAHVSSTTKKNATFSFAFLPLTTEQGAVIRDLEHTVPTYKYASKLEEKNHGAWYLRGDEAQPKLEPRKESFTVATKLTSTRRTQNPTLHALLHWKRVGNDEIKRALQRFLSLNSSDVLELARYVRELFEVLFTLLGSSGHAELQEAVFLALLHALGLLTDKKIAQSRGLVDSYIATLFKHSAVHQLLLQHAMKRVAECKETADQGLMVLARTMVYLFKLIIASKRNSNQALQQDAAFKQGLRQLLQAFNDILRSEDAGKAAVAGAPGGVARSESRAGPAMAPSSSTQSLAGENKEGGGGGAKRIMLLPAQVAIIRGYPEVVDELQVAFSARELGELAKAMVESIPLSDNTNLYKLNLLRLLLLNDVGIKTEAREVILPLLLDSLRVHLRRVEQSLSETYLCVAILMRLLTILEDKKVADPKVTWELRGILPELAHAVKFMLESERSDEGPAAASETAQQMCKVQLPVDAVMTLFTIVHLLGAERMQQFLGGAPVADLARLSEKLLRVFHHCLHISLFPPQWVVMHMFALSLIATTLHGLSEAIRARLQPGGANFEVNVWRQYFEFTLEFIGSENLRMESFSDAKRQFVISRYGGDLRTSMMAQLRVMWTALGPQRTLLTGTLVPIVFSMAQKKVFPQGQSLAMDLYYDMIVTEFASSKQFNQVERHTIDALYAIANMSQEAGDEFMAHLTSVLRPRLAAAAELGKAGLEFYDHVQRMYELMSSLLRFSNTPMYEDERTQVVLKLIKYLEDTGHVRKEMTSRYVQFLVDLHAGLGNWVEAGIAQLYQINVLEWGDEKLEAFGNFPAELERERKERLYKAAISFFKQGEDWERAIAVSEELRRYYETVSFDYEALAQTLADEAELFRSIVSRPRYYQTYYRVCFYGNFPDDIKEKDFVYRGVKLEPVMDFTSRIKKKYPDAKLHMSVDPPSSDMRAKNPLIIGVNALHVEKEESLKLRNRTMDEIKSVTGIGRPMPPGVSNYRYNNDVCVFSYTKAVQKSAEEKPKNEFQDLWVQKTYVTTAASFPCNRRRVEIVGKREVMLSPIENAIDSVQEKNEDVMAKTEDVTKGGDVGPLSMVLNGAIDAAVNGGTSKYLEAFLSPKYCQEHPDAVSLQRVRALRDALTLQHELLGRGLEVFGKSCGPQLQGLHQHLGAGLERMGKQFTEKFAALQAFLK